jgi:hypothetical protein
MKKEYDYRVLDGWTPEQIAKDDEWIRLFEEEPEEFHKLYLAVPGSVRRMTYEDSCNELARRSKKPTRNFLLNQSAGLQNQRINGILNYRR